MKQIQVDPDIQAWLASHALPGESVSATLRRELDIGGQSGVVDVDDDVYAFLVSHTQVIGESASDIIRRERDEPVVPVPEPHVVEFHIPAGTGNSPWNTRDGAVIGHVGDTLLIVNDDAVPHRPHTQGIPFPHAEADIGPGQSASFLLSAAFDPVTNGPLYDHDHGQGALFWIEVRAIP